MLLDSQHRMSDAQALTATAVSTNLIDLGSDGNVGIGEPMAVNISVGVAADITTGDETYQFDVQTATDAAFTTPVVLNSRVIAAASLTAGSNHSLLLPADTSGLRYLRVNYTLGGTTPSVTVDADLMPVRGLQNVVDYPSGFTVS